ncbi:telomere repeat-binding protein 5-like isoform X2 [Prunus yedoensis var. nudiflora]|uniref:Telomere repeat-binding protein 5-like isoform X2 n=1 Tax=Prunus yedoensis var. nudiflora TaxID=2094558 RepID=A0A314YTD4_PRUYE|nr:telomere repeat-binding protein 5-like isoform X2 [Prunus yedoensis var. nudiflora]
MVLQRRLDYGFNGYRVPAVPRASRSARVKGPIRKKLEANQIRAFEILASVAGNYCRRANILCQQMILVERMHISFPMIPLRANRRKATCQRKTHVSAEAVMSKPFYVWAGCKSANKVIH